MRQLVDFAARCWLKRLGWLAVMWLAGVLGMGLAAMLLRGLMSAAGLVA
jgi:hypothetical protein